MFSGLGTSLGVISFFFSSGQMANVNGAWSFRIESVAEVATSLLFDCLKHHLNGNTN